VTRRDSPTGEDGDGVEDGDEDEGGLAPDSPASRREVLSFSLPLPLSLASAGSAVAGLAGLSGCLAGGGPRAASEPWVRRTTVDEPGTRGVEGVVRLRRGEFLALPLAVTEAETAGMLRIRARERLSLPFDLLTLRRASLDAYRAGESVDPISSVSVPDSPSARVEGRLPAGEYALVVDNTRLGGAPPLDAVRVGLRVALET
jgi:hypothetical protein